MSSVVRVREGTPPPLIGKAGNYTVFITPPTTPRPSESPRTPPSSGLAASTTPKSPPLSPLTPAKFDSAPSSKLSSPMTPKSPPSPPPPPVQVPPQQFEKAKTGGGGGLALGFFWNAVSKVQDAHSSLDEYLANWFGLNQSKYQWALNDYYESTGMDKGGKPKELASKGSV